MATAVDYTALATLSDLDDHLYEGFDLDLTEGGAVRRLAIRQLQAATQHIEQHLHRDLIVRSVTQRFTREAWALETGREDAKYVAYVNQWPVVALPSGADSNLSLLPAGEAYRRLLSGAILDDDVTYFAGYRRADQSLSDLQGQAGLSGLTTLPPELPAEIVSACCEIALYLLESAKTGNRAWASRTQVVGQGTQTVERPQMGFLRAAPASPQIGFIQSQLVPLQRYRRIA